ncbi:hypothetical protein Tco_1410845 [Tanacetum coccineum]
MSPDKAEKERSGIGPKQSHPVRKFSALVLRVLRSSRLSSLQFMRWYRTEEDLSLHSEKKDMLYVKKNKADLLRKVTSKVGIEERDIESKEPPFPINAKRIEELSYLSNKLNRIAEAKASVLDFKDSPNDEEDVRSSQDYMNDLEEEYQARAFLANSKRFFKKGLDQSSKPRLELIVACSVPFGSRHPPPRSPFPDDNEFHSRSHSAILTIDVVSCLTLSDREYVASSYDQ